MSIAISVVLQPSKILRYSVTACAFILLFIAFYVATLKTLTLLNQSLFIAICFFAAWRSFLCAKKVAKTGWQMHINDLGQLRYQAPDVEESYPANLVAGTTLWPHALFLRLHNQKENTRTNMVVLPDMLKKDEFRRVLIACKWMVAHTASDTD
jgi:toxin CptA